MQRSVRVRVRVCVYGMRDEGECTEKSFEDQVEDIQLRSVKHFRSR